MDNRLIVSIISSPFFKVLREFHGLVRVDEWFNFLV